MSQNDNDEKHTLRTLLINLLVLLDTINAGIPRNLPPSRGALVCLVGVSSTYASRNWLWPNGDAILSVSDKVVVASEGDVRSNRK